MAPKRSSASSPVSGSASQKRSNSGGGSGAGQGPAKIQKVRDSACLSMLTSAQAEIEQEEKKRKAIVCRKGLMRTPSFAQCVRHWPSALAEPDMAGEQPAERTG